MNTAVRSEHSSLPELRAFMEVMRRSKGYESEGRVRKSITQTRGHSPSQTGSKDRKADKESSGVNAEEGINELDIGEGGGHAMGIHAHGRVQIIPTVGTSSIDKINNIVSLFD